MLPQMTRTTRFARTASTDILQSTIVNEPCGHCAACANFKSQSLVDFIEFDAEASHAPQYVQERLPELLIAAREWFVDRTRASRLFLPALVVSTIRRIRLARSIRCDRALRSESPTGTRRHPGRGKRPGYHPFYVLWSDRIARRNVGRAVSDVGGTAQLIYNAFFGFALVSSMPECDRADELLETLKFGILIGHYMSSRNRGRYCGKAQNLNRLLTADYDRALGEVDLLLMPTTPIAATRLPGPNASREEIVGRAFETVGKTAPTSVTGHPAISVPVARHRID